MSLYMYVGHFMAFGDGLQRAESMYLGFFEVQNVQHVLIFIYRIAWSRKGFGAPLE